MFLVEQFVFGTLLPAGEHEFSVQNFILYCNRLTFFFGGGLISHANLLLVFSCPSLVKISATFFGQVWRMLFWSSMRKLVAPKLLGGQCDSQKDLRVRNVCCLKLIDEVSMSSKLKTGYYHRFVFSFQQKYRAFHDLFGHARTWVNLI